MFFERPESGELAVLVHVDRTSESDREDPKEFEQLVISAGGDPADFVMGHVASPNPKFFIGTGKLEEVKSLVKAHKAEVVIFNNALSPSQERNLEAEFECRVLDRTGLILDIFAQRARTHEGKLQVELAQLQYVSTRLVRGWTHLERQKGGIGLRGPGETQLETDRRLLGARITTIQKRLEKVHKQRQQGRRARMRADIPTVSLVGYTNAGKSTLFNYITESEVYAADQLFATLDPTLRRLDIPDIGPIVLADTVGFIRHLPHKLVEAFKATLETATEADLLLHVVDAPCDEREANMEQVDHVLKEIGADELPMLLVYNKVDLMPDMSPRIERDDQGTPKIVWLSARTGDGLELLTQAISEIVGGEMVHLSLPLDHKDGKFRARLYAMSAVVSESIDDQGKATVEVRMPKKDLRRLMSQESMQLPDILVEHPEW